jgi:hypothetical protein
MSAYGVISEMPVVRFYRANDDGKLPDGQISKNLSSPAYKNISLNPSGKSSLQARPVSPEKGRIASRHERAVGCDGRDSVGRAMGLQGGSSRERSAGARTNDAANRLRQNSPDGTRSGKIFGVRWSRTAKSCGPGAPMLASSLAEMHFTDRVRDASSIRKATVANKPVTGESTK